MVPTPHAFWKKLLAPQVHQLRHARWGIWFACGVNWNPGKVTEIHEREVSYWWLQCFPKPKFKKRSHFRLLPPITHAHTPPPPLMRSHAFGRTLLLHQYHFLPRITKQKGAGWVGPTTTLLLPRSAVVPHSTALYAAPLCNPRSSPPSTSTCSFFAALSFQRKKKQKTTFRFMLTNSYAWMEQSEIG